MDNLTKRKKAIEKYVIGVPFFDIIAELKVSERWFYKWLNRYRLNPSGNWFEEESKRPKNIQNKYSEAQVAKVKRIRSQLLADKYSQVGAVNIQYKLREENEIMPVWVINRILKRGQLIRRPEKSEKQTIPYPGDQYVHVHAMDLVGPRYIKGYGRVYFLNIMDLESHFVQVMPLVSKQAEEILQAIIRFWQKIGTPDFLQMDNELSFRGSNKYPRSYGKIVRYALFQRVTPIFIPCAEPWRNGVIEKFNDTFDKRFFRQERFLDLDDAITKSIHFENYHNQNHRYSVLNQRTPEKARAEKLFFFPLNNECDIHQPISLKEGKVIIIRFIRSNLQLDIFGEKFKMPPHLQYSYVECIIDIEKEFMVIQRDQKIELIIPYPITGKEK